MRLILLGLVALCIVGLFSTRAPEAADRDDAGKTPSALHVALAAFATTATFFAWEFIVWTAARTQRPFPPQFARLPLLFIDDRAPLFGHAPYGVAAGIVAALQTGALVGLYRTLRGRRLDRTTTLILATAFVAMAASALWLPCVTSTDLYAYAAGLHAGYAGSYAPAQRTLGPAWDAITIAFPHGVPPSPYGPVWFAISWLFAAWAPSLGTALIALRLLELVAFVGCLAALRSIGAGTGALAVAALNPGIFSNDIVDGHNDLLAVAFVLAAMALRPRNGPLAALLAAGAGGIKLPFIAIGAIAFASEERLGRRIALAGASIAGGLALSIGIGGMPYLTALRRTAAIYAAAFADPLDDVLRAALLITVLGGIALALLRKRYIPTLPWTFVAFGTQFFAWYFAWGVAYAAAERRWLGVYLIALPQLTYVLSTIYAPTRLYSLEFLLTIFLAAPVALSALKLGTPAADQRE